MATRLDAAEQHRRLDPGAGWAIDDGASTSAFAFTGFVIALSFIPSAALVADA